MNSRRYAIAAVIALAGFSALFAVLPSRGAGTKVEMQGNQYRPSTVRIATGGAITFTNEDDVTHTASCQGRGCPKDSGDIQPGLFKTLTFNNPGTYHIVCLYHGDAGMVATVTVGAASAPTPRPTGSPSPTASPSP